ncbi:hypothetical protein ILUMI_26638 [Ignelater luminosus]|uniref:Uncharacterized protein n=1 Tax=Ignelater luminosus TaxID=2038154 RepID=A0A8K0C6E1_IGNLU|nr:hypothetical protein ILUMI_26638 [Ignelater luminosus]
MLIPVDSEADTIHSFDDFEEIEDDNEESCCIRWVVRTTKHKKRITTERMARPCSADITAAENLSTTRTRDGFLACSVTKVEEVDYLKKAVLLRCLSNRK